MMFQKNYVVWKDSKKEIYWDKKNQVSEELCSMERLMQVQALMHLQLVSEELCSMERESKE